MGMITITDHKFGIIINTYCSCGGRGPDDDPCPACAVYHAVMAEQDHSTKPASKDYEKPYAKDSSVLSWMTEGR